MEDLRELKPEKYWQKTTKSAEARKQNKELVKTRFKMSEYIASIKKDGEYQRFIKQDGKSTITGRGISKLTGTYKDNSENMPIVLNYLDKEFEEGTCFIGEAFIPGGKNTAVRSVIGSGAAKAKERDKKTPVFYYIFDIWALNGKSLMGTEFRDRVAILERLRERLEKCERIKVANFVFGAKQIEELVAYSLTNSEEGVVAVLADSKPSPGSRTSWKTVKIKQEFAEDMDVFFTGEYRPANRLYTGKELKNWLFWENLKTGEKTNDKELYKDYINGAPIEPITKPYFYGHPASLEIAVYDNKNDKIISLGYVSSGLTDKIRADFTKNKEKFVKRPALIQGMELTEDFQVRHPNFLQFREDTIDWKSCSLDKIK